MSTWGACGARLPGSDASAVAAPTQRLPAAAMASQRPMRCAQFADARYPSRRDPALPPCISILRFGPLAVHLSQRSDEQLQNGGAAISFPRERQAFEIVPAASVCYA